jgi:hypothetical protein
MAALDETLFCLAAFAERFDGERLAAHQEKWPR